MFDHAHYVPVLNWKKGERDAVQRLTYSDKRRMTPLLEVFADRRPPQKEPKHPHVKGDWLVYMAKTIQHCWDPRLHAFAEVVAEPLVPVTDTELNSRTLAFFHAARLRDLKLIPVVRLAYADDRRAVIRSVVQQDGRGVCLRLTGEDIHRPRLREDIENLFAQLGTTAEQTHLLVDLHVLGPEGYNLMLVCALLPFLEQWNTFTVVGGAFPSGLARMEYGRNEVPRSEWRAWSTQVLTHPFRKPAFGDYATQHPIPFNPTIHPNPCASIRYTLEDHWLVLKGQQLVPRKKERDQSNRYEQFPVLAGVLVNARGPNKQPYFRGGSFSRGDGYILDMASGYRSGAVKGEVATGNPQTWLTAAVNQHLTFVVIQISTLFSSSDGSGRTHAGAQAGPPRRAGYRAPSGALRRAPAPRRVAPKT
jgi:hypothetical protein